MASVNKCILLGNLGTAPEIRAFESGGRIATFSLATSETWRDRSSGEKKEKTEWHNIVIQSEGLVKIAEQYLKKGSKIYLEGSLRTRKWQDQNGQDRYTTEVVLTPYNSTLIMLDTRKDGDTRGYEQAYGQQEQPQSTPEEIDDSIPF